MIECYDDKCKYHPRDGEPFCAMIRCVELPMYRVYEDGSVWALEDYFDEPPHVHHMKSLDVHAFDEEDAKELVPF